MTLSLMLSWNCSLFMFDKIYDLYLDNHPRHFWKLLEKNLTDQDWENSYKDSWSHLIQMNSFSDSIASILSYSLGEAQFGFNRWSLSPFQRFYYQLKPFFPRALTVKIRQYYRLKQEKNFSLGWPIEDRYAQLQFEAVSKIFKEQNLSQIPFIWFWPNQKRTAFVLTHDVETFQGVKFVRHLADLEQEFGFRSSFNFIPERYPVERELLEELSSRGFEIGIHGLKHDGKLFTSRKVFEQRVKRINHYLQKWGAVGFRTPLTHRHPLWMQSLKIEYDSSFFDTDPYEPMAGGTMSIWPFLIGHFVEMPYTLPQDHTLMVILGETTPQLWIEKVKFIERYYGMILLNTHPDYLCQPTYLRIYRQFLQEMKNRQGYWHALPCEVARWWRSRHRAKEIQDLPNGSLSYLQLTKTGNISVSQSGER